jgi:hypothetical protein
MHAPMRQAEEKKQAEDLDSNIQHGRPSEVEWISRL